MTFLQWVKIYKGTSTHFVSHVYLDALLFDGEKIRSCNLHDVSRLATQLKIGTNVRTWTRGKRKGKKRRISRFGKINAIYVELGPPVPALERPLDILRLAFYRRWGKKPNFGQLEPPRAPNPIQKLLRARKIKNPGCFFGGWKMTDARECHRRRRRRRRRQTRKPKGMIRKEEPSTSCFPLSPFDFLYRIASRSVKNGVKIIIFFIF